MGYREVFFIRPRLTHLKAFTFLVLNVWKCNIIKFVEILELYKRQSHAEDEAFLKVFKLWESYHFDLMWLT